MDTDGRAWLLAHTRLRDTGYVTPCREWTGAVGRDGYGVAWFDGRTMAAHRAAWLAVRGAIPARHDIHHRCRYTLCCEPEHLLPQPCRTHDREHAHHLRQMYCKRGHPLSGANVRFVGKKSERRCVTCQRERDRAYRRRSRHT